MAQQGDRFLRVSATVFKILAWVALILQVVMGLILVIGGGVDVPIGGVSVPTRMVGVLNIVAAVVYWFLFMLVAAVIRLLLDLHAHVTKSAP